MAHRVLKGSDGSGFSGRPECLIGECDHQTALALRSLFVERAGDVELLFNFLLKLPQRYF